MLFIEFLAMAVLIFSGFLCCLTCLVPRPIGFLRLQVIACMQPLGQKLAARILNRMHRKLERRGHPCTDSAAERKGVNHKNVDFLTVINSVTECSSRGNFPTPFPESAIAHFRASHRHQFGTVNRKFFGRPS
jgi:hypothetical protein